MEFVWKIMIAVIGSVLVILSSTDGELPKQCGFNKVPPPRQVTGNQAQVVYGQHNLFMCENGSCAQIQYCRLENMFPGVFLTEETYEQRNPRKPSIPPTCQGNGKRKKRDGTCNTNNDGDDCCPTTWTYRPFDDTTESLENSHGESCFVLHLSICSGKYQWTTEAECGVVNGSCQGNCELQNVAITLLAWCPNSVLAFHHFDIPVYCSCKNVVKADRR